MAAVPPLLHLPTITHVTSHGSSVTPGDGNLGDAGAVASATNIGPQPGELGPLELSNAAKAIMGAFGAIKSFFSKYGSDLKNIGEGALGSMIASGVAKFGKNAISAINAYANAAASAQQAEVSALNGLQPGLGTFAKDYFDSTEGINPQASAALFTDIATVISDNGEINWGAVFGELP